MHHRQRTGSDSYSGQSLRIRSVSARRSGLGTSHIGRVISWHGQSVERPGAGVRIVGHAPDRVVEAIEVGGGEATWIAGVQWHPEVARRDVLQRRLFESFVAAADRFRARGLHDRPQAQ